MLAGISVLGAGGVGRVGLGFVTGGVPSVMPTSSNAFFAAATSALFAPFKSAAD